MHIPRLICPVLIVVAQAGCATGPSGITEVTVSIQPDPVVPGQFAMPSDSDAVVDVGKVSVPPKKKKWIPVVLPKELRDRGGHGDALVDVVVSKDGTVREAKLVRASDPVFGELVRFAILQWTFHPALIDGKPVNCRLLQPMSYQIGE